MLGHRHENGQSTRVSVSSASSSPLEGSVSETPVDASLPQVPLQYTKKNHGNPILQSYENQNMNTFRSATTPNMHDQLHRDHHHEQQQQQQQQQFSYPPSNAGGQVPPEPSHTVPSPPNANTLPTVSSTSSDIAGTGTSVYGTDLSQANKDLIFDGLKNIYKNKVFIPHYVDIINQAVFHHSVHALRCYHWRWLPNFHNSAHPHSLQATSKPSRLF